MASQPIDINEIVENCRASSSHSFPLNPGQNVGRDVGLQNGVSDGVEQFEGQACRPRKACRPTRTIPARSRKRNAVLGVADAACGAAPGLRIGPAHDVSLSEARILAANLRKTVRAGHRSGQ